MIRVEDAVEIIKAIGLDDLELKVVDGNVVVIIPEGLSEYARIKSLKTTHEKTPKPTIKKNFKKYANEHNLTAEKLSGILDVKKSSAQSFLTLSNPSAPNLVHIMMLASYLSIDELLFYEDGEAERQEKATPETHMTELRTDSQDQPARSEEEKSAAPSQEETSNGNWANSQNR